ncbi:hypothetical protein APHAL10511_002275 [Amanita phalloides]|nr:hypothetical protein APHAL10511_002275 [Amanita phalloides]
MHIHSKPTVKDQWDVIVAKKGAFAQTEMHEKNLAMKYPEKGNVHKFLDRLCVKKEELAAMGATINNKDYLSTIISSLPYYLANLCQMNLQPHSFTLWTKPFPQAAQPRPTKKEGGDGTKDELLATTSGSSSDGKKRDLSPKGLVGTVGR